MLQATTLKAPLQHSVWDADDVVEKVRAFPEKAAAVIRPLLRSLTLEEYQHFLSAMYHYTHDSEGQLLHAAAQCDDPGLKDYFKQMAREERGHYLLAKRDYEAFGLQVDEEQVPKQAKEFREYWYRLGKQDCNEFVGAMYVFESVADLVGKEVIDMIERLQLTKKQARWLLVHLEADHGHGSEALEMCKRYAHRNPQALFEAAQEGAKRWIEVFQFAFSTGS